MGEPMRDFEGWARSIRNFQTWIGDSAPGAMDLDVLIERRGQFLVFEGKPWRGDLGVSVSYGQHLALAALSECEEFTVYLIGEDDKRLWVAPYSRSAPKTFKNEAVWLPKHFVKMSVRGFQALVRDWWDEASAA